MRSAILCLLTSFLGLCGCTSGMIQPESRSERIADLGDDFVCTVSVETTSVRSSRSCTPIERVQHAFAAVRVNTTTLGELKRMGFGPPHSSMELVPAPEIKYRLTKTTDGGLETLDESVLACVTGASAAYRCKMAIFADAFDQSVGTNNPVARLLSLRKVDVVSGWSWEAAFVVEHRCNACTGLEDDQAVVVYKQLRPYENPPTRKTRKLPILDSAVDLRVP